MDEFEFFQLERQQLSDGSYAYNVLTWHEYNGKRENVCRIGALNGESANAIMEALDANSLMERVSEVLDTPYA